MIAALLTVVALVAPPCWSPPVDRPVARPFVAPACSWCPGHRGIEYRTTPGTPVHAVAAGTVTFAGTVVGATYLVTEVAPGVKVTYGLLVDVAARAGQRVAAGQVVGRSTARLYLGVRQGNRPVDPAPFLGRPTGPSRLLPVDRRAARPAGSPRPACAAGPPAR